MVGVAVCVGVFGARVFVGWGVDVGQGELVAVGVKVGTVGVIVGV